jgi:predicted nucleic acid-binding protein
VRIISKDSQRSERRGDDFLKVVRATTVGGTKRSRYGREQRRRVLNNALIFSTAREYGCAILSRNVRDFDLLQHLDAI